MTRPLKHAADLAAAWADVQLRADDLLQRSIELADESCDLRGGSWRPYSIQLRSCNRKLAPQREERARSGRKRNVPIGPFVASTYAAISVTCPNSCPFRNNGCYAQSNGKHTVMGRLDAAARGLDGLEVTRREAEALRRLWPRQVPQDGAQGGRDLRLHVGGDASSTRGARLLADAVESLIARGLGSAWTFTHLWRTIAAEAWGPIHVLASVETVEDFGAARRRGYSPALTVERFTDPKPRRVRGIRMVPCPFEASPNEPTCSKCRLCLGDRYRAGDGIVFAAHGNEAKVARKRLHVLNAGGSRHVW